MGGVQQQRQSEGRCGGEKVPFWSESVNYGKRKNYPALQPPPSYRSRSSAPCALRSWPVPVNLSVMIARPPGRRNGRRLCTAWVRRFAGRRERGREVVLIDA